MSLRKAVFSTVFCLATLGFHSAKGEEMRQGLQPPVAQIVPMKLDKHGDVRVDNYYWLNQRADPEVIKYLEAENEYTKANTRLP